MPASSATIDAHAIRAARGQVLEDGTGVDIGGWIIQSSSASITADAEMERHKETLHLVATPEQFFGSNFLRLEHKASGVELRFDAMGALLGWMEDGSEAVQVGEAREWQQSRQRDLRETGAQTLQYDWTFTTGYRGSVGKAKLGGAAPPVATPKEDASRSRPASDEAPVPPNSHPQLSRPAAAAGAAGGCRRLDEGGFDGAEGAGDGVPEWRPTLDQMNRGLLMSRDPILFYAEIPLYESELEDHGASQVSVKVRVMPRCWYVLLRFWLRVDHVLVRLRETRLFCQFDTPQAAGVVLREVRHCEGTFQELREGGAPPEGPAYADADATSAALMAAAPVGVKLYRQDKMVLQ